MFLMEFIACSLWILKYGFITKVAWTKRSQSQFYTTYTGGYGEYSL